MKQRVIQINQQTETTVNTILINQKTLTQQSNRGSIYTYLTIGERNKKWWVF